MDESIHVVFGNSIGNSLRSFNMYIFEIEVPDTNECFSLDDLLWNILSGIVASNKIVDNIRVPDTLLQRLCVSQIVFLPEVSQGDPDTIYGFSAIP